MRAPESRCAGGARLRAAGAVILAASNMFEFAFGGVGLNPHFGTPKNPYDKENGRVSRRLFFRRAWRKRRHVRDGARFRHARSIRQPAALCGVAGFKPTARAFPREGAFPLSFTLDSVGAVANSPPAARCTTRFSPGAAIAVAEMPAKG